MNLRPYLPSAKLTVMVASLALSAGLVVAAQYATRTHQATLASAATPAPQGNWQQALQDVVAQTGIQAPAAPNPATLETLLAAAHTNNLTQEVGRSLVLNLSSYAAQGLGQDAPTQDQLVAQALAQINASASSTQYQSADLSVVPTDERRLAAYGNGVMAVLLAHPEASAGDTLKAIDAASAQGAAALKPLGDIGAGYAAIAQELLALPVPQTLAPLHLQLVNDYAAMAACYPDLEQLVADPLRGVAALKRYASLMDETRRVLTTIAQDLNKEGILFTKDEPGSNWNGFLSS